MRSQWTEVRWTGCEVCDKMEKLQKSKYVAYKRNEEVKDTIVLMTGLRDTESG